MSKWKSRDIPRREPLRSTATTSTDLSNPSTGSVAPPSETPDTDLDSQSPTNASLRRRFTSSWAQRRRDKGQGESLRGPLGLHLLQSSPDPLIDLIFVHGLRGGSIKTWRKGEDIRGFWPQLWLPIEPRLRHTNIHSFGYDSDWAGAKTSILSVHDFGQSLLEEMRNSPYLKSNRDAFILAQHVPDFQSRIKCIFFLATPHRGSDYAATLNNILAVSGIGSSRQYIAELTTGSESMQLLNDEFGKHAHDLRIFSFYETLRMSLGVSSALIVAKTSAVLGPGYINERVQYLNANHRDICKFDSPDDPNYVTLKNALASAADHLLEDVVLARSGHVKEQMDLLIAYLGISDRPEEDYPKVEGSCQWIDEREEFEEWRDSASTLPYDHCFDDGVTADNNISILWVRADPGTGKTHLASYVISELQDFQLECAYYYFHDGNKTSGTLGGLLRSLAYQMSVSNAAIRERLLELCREGSTFDKDDPRSIWNKVFKRGIFHTRILTTQYWVIDALDECSKYQELFSILRGEKLNFPLRILLTSRKIPDIQRLTRPLEATSTISVMDIPIKDSVIDIERYINSRIENLPVDQAAEKEDLAATILRKSNACFLWVRIVMDELEHVYSKESILQVLEGIPEGMVPYYERTVGAMAENKLEKHITKAVLLWVVGSSRKMTLPEISQALKLDINTVLPSAKSAIEGLCGQLVTVHGSADVVDVVHPTVREFLLCTSAGEFAVSKPRAHERIAMTCLKLLCSFEMQPPRNRRLVSQPRSRVEPSPLLDYAITQFSEHIYSASSETDVLLLAIDRFFKTNVLSWIEKVAQKGDLYCLVRAAKNLTAYLDRRAKYRSPLSNPVKNLARWSMDLSRLATRFGTALLNSPASIHFVIPPLCPTESAIFQQFGRRPDGLSVAGFRAEVWDDCIASVSFGDDIATSVSCGENLIAVGMESGDLNLYNHRSCQKFKRVSLKDPVDAVHFADNYIAACTTRSIVVQDLDGNQLWETRIRFRCILLTSTTDSIIAVSQHGHVLKWALLTGNPVEDHTIPYASIDSEIEAHGRPTRAPSVASISPDSEVLALGYRGGAVCIWEIDSCVQIGWAVDPENRLASRLLFNPNPELNLLAVIYSDHGISLYDTWSGALVHTHKSTDDAGPTSLSCSPDGRTLATTKMKGTLQLWDFESLTLLYHVVSPAQSFRLLNFTSDSSSLIDVTDSTMNIWSPAALVRKTMEEDSSISDDAAQLIVSEGQYKPLRASRITFLCAHTTLPLVFVGRYDGQVVAFSSKTGEEDSVLYTHSSGEFITEIIAGRNNILASSDVSGTVQVWRLKPSAPTSLTTDVLLLKLHHVVQIKQICFDPTGKYLLVSSAHSDTVFLIEDGTSVGSLRFRTDERKAWRWLESPHEQATTAEFTLLSDHTMKRYIASSFPELATTEPVHLQYNSQESSSAIGPASAVIQRVVQPSSRTLIVEVSFDSSYAASTAAFIFDPGQISSAATAQTLVPVNHIFTEQCRHFIGASQGLNSIIFLHRNGWITSLNTQSLPPTQSTQHFFIGSEHVGTSQEAMPTKTVGDDIVLCLHGELSVIKNGFK